MLLKHGDLLTRARKDIVKYKNVQKRCHLYSPASHPRVVGSKTVARKVRAPLRHCKHKTKLNASTLVTSCTKRYVAIRVLVSSPKCQ